MAHRHTKSLSGFNVQQFDDKILSKVYGVMYKWTNFVYGWQKRYFELENGILVYYKSESEKQYGSRGSVALRIARLVESDIDFFRFDILTNGTCWYLKAENRKARNLWLRALKYQMNNCRSNSLVAQESNGSASSALLSGHQVRPFKKQKTHYSADDLAKSTDSVEQSPLSLELISKVEELERYNEMIGRQTVRLEKLIHTINDNHGDSTATTLLDESLALNAVTVAVLQNINTCVHLLAKQTHFNYNRRNSEGYQIETITDNSNRTQSSVLAHQTSSVMESILSDDEQEWHDAYDSTPQKGIDDKRQAAGKSGSESSMQRTSRREDQLSISESPPKEVTLPASCPFEAEINRIAMEQLKYAKAGVQDNVWELFMEEGEMKMFKRELEIDGIVYDPLKAVHVVDGVSAREYIHYFFEPRYKSEWDETLVMTRVVERISTDTVIVHQLHKRVWPTAQRESLFWSNVRYLPEEKSPDALDLYMVCNHDCDLPDVPNSSNVRVGITVAMLCETVIKNGHEKPVEELKRKDIRCRICYCAQVDPGGWVPVSALRVIYKREYPKFLRGFTKYVLDNVKSQPLKI